MKNIIYWVLAGFIYVLGIFVGVVLVASLGMNFAPFIDASSSFGSHLNVAAWAPAAPFQQLPALAISTAALIAFLAYIQNKKQSKSESFFRQASQELDQAINLLRDRNNDRIIWIRAARSLLQAQKISEKIELEEVQLEYRLYEQRVRNDLYLVLAYDQKTGQREILQPQFFYGVPDWKAGKSLDEVAVETSHRMEAHRVEIDKVPPQPHLNLLSEESVVAIFDFLEYPKDYEDLLQNVQVWSTGWDMVFGEKMGAARYIHHRQTKYTIDGKLYDRNPNENEGE